MPEVDWNLADEMINRVFNKPEGKRALARVLFKLNACTKSQLESIEKRIDRQEAMAKLRKSI